LILTIYGNYFDDRKPYTPPKAFIGGNYRMSFVVVVFVIVVVVVVLFFFGGGGSVIVIAVLVFPIETICTIIR
jgi:hypothetical protein